MELVQFIFWEAVKILALALLAILSAKAIAGLAVHRAWIKTALYAVVLGLVGTGAWFAGNDVAAEVYLWTSLSDLGKNNLERAYSNGLRAVELRPARLDCWRVLEQSKLRLDQVESVLDDKPVFQALSKGQMDEADEYQFALCSYKLGRYTDSVQITSRLIQANPLYAAPYVLQGIAELAQHDYSKAQRTFTAVLQHFPTQQAAIEGLAHAYYLGGERQKALAVLDETAKYQFPAPVRSRFEALKGLYDQ